MHVDAHEASDSSTPADVTVQANPTTRIALDDDNDMEDVEELDVEPPGETQSSTDVSAHPVQVQDVTAHPVQRPLTLHEPPTPQELHDSATSLKFKEILNASPRSPGLNPSPFTPVTVAPTISPLLPSESTSETSFEPSTLTRVAPVSLSPSFEPTPQAPSPASTPEIYYVPSNPERSHSVITIQMNHIQGSKDPIRSSKPAAFAVPSELVAPICRYIESRVNPDSDLRKLTTDHPIVKTFVHGDARFRPRPSSWMSEKSPPPPGPTLRDAFMRRAQRYRGFREMEEEAAALKDANAKINDENAKFKDENAKLKANATKVSNSSTQQTKTHETPQSIETPRRRTKTVPDPFTADGKLVLGRTKEIEVDEYGIAINPTDEPILRRSKFTPYSLPYSRSNECLGDMETRKRAQLEQARRIANIGESPYTAEQLPGTDGGLVSASQEQVQPEQAPETPRARGWGLSSFLPSARSFTKYIPFSSRRAISTPQQQPSQPQQVAQTEPRVHVDSSQSQADPDMANAVTGPGPRRHQSTSNQQRLLTKVQTDEEKRIKKMRAQLRREAEALERQKKDLEIAKKDLAEQRKLADTAQTTGQKRKRLPSPDVIPLPAGGGFGLVDEYFIAESSSDEEDGAAQETPTKERPLKKARTSAPDNAIVSSPFRARPYTGTLFAHPDSSRSRQDDNVFVEPDQPDAHPALDSTPPPGPTLTFKVPSPGSSDSDEDEDEQEQNNQKAQEASSPSVSEPKSILRNSPLFSNHSQSRSTSNSSSPSKTMVPPSRPSPGHANSSAATTVTPSGALEKAREKALKHQPKQPSTLRESSRLSTSTVNSDVGDQEHVEEYDPAHPAILPSPSKVSVFEQPATPATSAFGQPIMSPTAPTAFQQPVTQGVSGQPHVQPAMPSMSEQRIETSHDVISGARDQIQSNGQQAVSAKESNEFLSDTDRFIANRNPKIKADMDRYWAEHGDDYVLGEGYEEFANDMIAEEQKLMEGPNGLPYKQPHNIISSAFDRFGADSLADRGIQAEIEDNWRPGDLERTESDPTNGMRVFFNRLVKNGAIERDLADRVIAIGVPPGITEYLAGQGVTGPVAA